MAARACETESTWSSWANARKPEQLGNEVAQPRRILPEVDGTGMEVRRLGREPHDLVTLDFEFVRADVDLL
jgi:hypothetical protein